LPEVNPDKCIVCGCQREFDEVFDLGPICPFCSGDKTSEMLAALDQEITQEVASTELLDCDGVDLFRFVSDLGSLGSSHMHLQVVRDVIGSILISIKGKNRVDYYSLRRRTDPVRLVQILDYLDELGYIKVHRRSDSPIIDHVTIPKDNIIDKAYVAMEATEGWKQHREPSFVMAALVIKGLDQAIGVIKEQGSIKVGEGITRLYVSGDKVYVPRQFTAPLMFILGSWANSEDEFTESSISSFMTRRGIQSKERDRVVRFIGGLNPGSQNTIYKMETYSPGMGIKELRFVLNPQFAAVRERLRSRTR
jgi:hypothetical protein